MSPPFTAPPARLTIGSLDNVTLTVTAHYNPKDLDLSRNVPWTAIQANNNRDPNRAQKDVNDIEFTGGEGRHLSLELLFDGFEAKRSVASEVDTLDKLARVVKPGSAGVNDRRPHQCVVVWGGGDPKEYIPPLRCVIGSLSVKYTMFTREGKPVRAVVQLKLREAFVKFGFGDADDDRANRLAALRYEPPTDERDAYGKPRQGVNS